jgi:hypothetical protein
MILLTIIAVGLLSLSSIALRSSSQDKAMATARSNARLSLMLAIGELQKHSGPDQRITAAADIAGDADGLRVAAGAVPQNDNSVSGVSKGLSPVQAGTRYWTGIFASKDTPVSIFTKTPSPSLVQWLVSGSPGIVPSDVTYAVGGNGQVSDSTKAVVLVGQYSVGNGATDSYVVAPVLAVMDPKTAKPVGRFAWWVGDEGVKARINMSRTLDVANSYAALTAQRRGWETVAGFASYPAPSSADQLSLPKVTSLGQTELLIPAVGAEGGGPTSLQNVFHSATADSRAVLADTLNGGTRIDLSALLAEALPTSNPVAEIANYPVKGANVVSKTAAPNMKAPGWDAVKAAYDRHRLLTDGSLIVAPASTNFTSAVAPLVTDFRLLMGAKIVVKDAANGLFNINPCGKIAIVIANPYSVPLRWSNDIELEVKSDTPPGNKPSSIWSVPGRPAYLPQNPGDPAVFNNAVFRIRTSSLAPGEARAYTIASPFFRTAASASGRLVIDLAAFNTSAPFDFNNCIELEHTDPVIIAKDHFKTPYLYVLEERNTSLATLEMRLTGSSGLLRRIERFELDNGYFRPNQRVFTRTEANKMTRPFPLMLYSFQISQPGVEYKNQNLIPATYEMGQRGSTLRTFADFNLQATRIRKPITSYNPPPYFMESNDSIALLPASPPGGETGAGFTRNLALSPLPWGRSSSGSKKTVLFTVPSQFSSLAQFQHVDLTGDDTMASIGHQPGNAVGNSYATPFVKRALVIQSRTEYEVTGVGSANQTPTNYYDLSYLLNASLWDSYFFSTIPRTGESVPENPSLIRFPDAGSPGLKDPVEAAPLLMVEGAFNVNSTEKNAWKAFLASAKHFKHTADTANNTTAAFPRSLEQISPSATPPTGNDADSFSGYRRLTDTQLDALAEEIVKQVRLRGPFVSLSHFVNRAISNLVDQPALSRAGALQCAIDESTNINFTGTKNAFSSITPGDDAVTLRETGGAPRADLDGEYTSSVPASARTDPDWAITSADRNYGTVASIIADREMLKDAKYKPEQGYRSTGIPGWLTQADVLQVIGPSLTARSDTFRIRAFGEALDASGKSIAKAYCEATVQRVPNYVDPSNPASARGTSVSKPNTTYGRQFQIASFRWLSPLEI